MVLKIDNELFLVLSFQHHKPGKGAAVVRIKLKNLSKETTIEKTFRSGEMLDDVELNKTTASYSYKDEDSIVFMDLQTYDQILIPEKDIQDIGGFLKEGVEVSILLHNGKPVTVIPPNFIELKVKYAEEGIKGNTTTNPTKPVQLETGVSIHVPLFVKQGDTIKVDLRDLTYVERIK